MIPKVTWGGAWHKWRKAALKSLQTKIEKCACGKVIPNRSRALAWITQLGLELDPMFVAAMAAVRREMREARLSLSENRVRRSEGKRWQEIRERWGWGFRRGV